MTQASESTPPTDPLRSHSAHVKQIRSYIQVAVASNKQSEILLLGREDAPIALDVLLTLLAKSSRLEKDQLRKLAVQILEVHDRLPDSLVLEKVERVGADAAFSGQFSDIFRGKYEGKDVALKRLRAYLMFSGPSKTHLKQEFYGEALIWKTLSHPNVLPLLGITEDVFQHTPCTVLPWMENGHILHHLQTLKERNDVPGNAYRIRVNEWMRQVASGLVYLHGEGVIHGSLRATNILIDSDGNVQLTDFGMTRISETVQETYASMPDGTVRWQAPELVDPDMFNISSSGPTYASDVYSFACVFIELYTLKPPFAGMSDYQVAARIVKGVRPPRPSLPDNGTMSEDIWALVTQCWASKPEQRPTTQGVLERMTFIAANTSPAPPTPSKDPRSPRTRSPLCGMFYPWRGIRRCITT